MQESDKTFTRLTRSEGDVVFLQPCLDVVCYWSGSAFDRADGIVEFYRLCLELIGDRLRYYRTETMSRSRRLGKDSLELVPFWFSKTKARRDIYMLNLESAAHADEPSDCAFAMQAIEDADPNEAVGFVRLVLPVARVEPDAAPFAELALRLFASIDCASGNAGYSLNWNELSDEEESARGAMSAIRKRYPGLDLSDPSSSMYCSATGIKCVNWLTHVGSRHVASLGDIDQLRMRLGDDIQLHSLPKALVIQAGPRPELGDVNRQQKLPLYHRVGNALATIRSPEHPAFIGRDGDVDEAESEAWLARFDR